MKKQKHYKKKSNIGPLSHFTKAFGEDENQGYLKRAFETTIGDGKLPSLNPQRKTGTSYQKGLS